MRKQIRQICMALIVSLSMILNVTPVLAQDTADTVTIYHTNDVHGYVTEDAGSGVIGLGKVAGLKAADPDSILVDVGDATQGLPIASLTQGADIISLMNAAGYDLMTVGNHEFDYGVDVLQQNISSAAFPVLGANVEYDGSLLQDHVMIDRGEYRIGFFGVVTKDTATSTNPEGVQGVAFRDEIETAREQVALLQQEGADVIVAMVHCGDVDVSTSAAQIAQNVPGIDVIIDGHSHRVENELVNNVLIVQTGTQLAGVGKLEIAFGTDEEVSVTETLLTYADLQDVAPLTTVEDQLASINASQSDLLNEPVTSVNTTLWAGQIEQVIPTRVVETNLGDLVTDAFKEKGEEFAPEGMPVVAVENGGGIRAAISNGTVTKGDLISAFPFSNTLYMKVVSPKDLYAMMDVSFSLMNGQDPDTGMLLQTSISGGFLQMSGMTVVLDPQTNTVVSITLDGASEALDPNDDTRDILLVGNNYILSGGSHYDFLAELPKYGEAGGELETIQAYMQTADLSQYTCTQNRIRYTGGAYQPKDYQASLTVVDEQGNLLTNQEVALMVDGQTEVRVKSDENGLVKLTLTDGSHGIRGLDQTTEVYVDNYLGFGLTEDAIRGSFPTVIATVVSDPQTPETSDPETPEEEEQPSQSQDPQKDPTVQQGENTSTQTNSTLWLAVLGVAAAVLIVIGILMKRKK